MSVHNQVTIVGGGPCGSLLAIVLKQRGYDVSVYEMRSEEAAMPVEIEQVEGGGLNKLKSASSRSINFTLSYRGIEALKAAGVASEIMQRTLPMPGRFIHMVDGTTAIQPYGSSSEDALYSVPRWEVAALLVRLACERGVKYNFDMKFIKLSPEGHCIFKSTVDGNEVTVTSDATFGCDGAFSRVRQSVNRLGRIDLHTYFIEEGYKELSIPPIIDENGQPQFAFSPTYLHVWPRDSFMLLAMPNSDKTFTCTFFAPMDQMEEMRSNWSKQQIEEFFTHHFPDAVPFISNLAAEFFASKASPLCQVKMSPWTFKNVALLGDASHAVVPFYGQGMNSAFEDTLVVSEILDGASRKGLSKADALMEVLASITEARQPAADGLNKLCIMNYTDIASHSGRKTYLVRKRIEGFLHMLFPKFWIPLYTMVTFTRLPYNEVLDRHFRQEWILSQLSRIFIVGTAAATLFGIKKFLPLKGILNGLFSA